MKLSKLDEFLEVAEYKHGDESLEVTFNANAFTSAFFRGLGASMRERFALIEKEDKASRRASRQQKPALGFERVLAQLDGEALAIEVERDIYAEVLATYIIKSWTAEDDAGNPLPPTFENLRRLSPRALKELFKFLREYKRPLEQETAGTTASPTISETTADGSSPEEQARAVASPTS